jgi:hypothetical protein
VNLDGLEGELVYFNAQLGGKVVERCSFVVRWRWWAAQRGEESTLARAGGSGSRSRSDLGSGRNGSSSGRGRGSRGGRVESLLR